MHNKTALKAVSLIVVGDYKKKHFEPVLVFYKNNKYLWGNKTICLQEVNRFLIKKNCDIGWNRTKSFHIYFANGKEQGTNETSLISNEVKCMGLIPTSI